MAEAIGAYQAALEVYTRTLLPQQWALTQNNLGTALRDQGVRTDPEEGRRLLNEAVGAYRAALEVFTPEHTRWYWVHVQTNLLRTLRHLEDARGMAEVLEEQLLADPDNAELYNEAQYLYHEVAFDFPSAHRLTTTWLARHPDDLVARSNLAESLFTTGRLDEARDALTALLQRGSHSEAAAKDELPSGMEVALRLLYIATLTGLGEMDDSATARGELHALLTAQPKDFQVGWSFQGSRHFVAAAPAFAPHRERLLPIFEAAGDGRDVLLRLIQ